MTPRTKYILKEAIDIFSASTDDEKDNLISQVQSNLKAHHNSLKSIGFGCSQDTVMAGKIFLRIFNK